MIGPTHLTLAELIDRVRARRRRGELLVATGQYGAFEGGVSFERVGVLRLGVFPRLVADHLLPKSEVAELRSALATDGPVLAGELDTMARTPWRRAWTVGERPFRLWTRLGLQLRVDDHHLHLRRIGWWRVAREDVSEVEARFSGNMVRGTLMVRRTSGNPFAVATYFDPVAVLDSTYDGINFDVDTSWVDHLGTSLARAISVPYRKVLAPDAAHR